jgi:hypothetical protein
MKTIIYLLTLALLLSTATGQTKRPARSATPKKAPITIQTATTKDGRTVLLKSDGTWEFTNDPVVPPAAAEIPKQNESEPVETPSPTPEIVQPKDADIVGVWDLKLSGPTGQTLPATLRVEATNGQDVFTSALDLGPKQMQSGLVIANRKFVTRFQESGQTLAFEGELSNSGLTGTFSITGPQGGQSAFTGSRRIAGTQVDAGLGVLSVQAGIVYKMGGAQAVARTTFHLLRKDLVDILTSAGLRADKNMDLLTTYAFAVRFQSSKRNYSNFYQVATAAIAPSIVATTVTDFSGLAQFPAVPAGSYYVIGYSETRGGFALWNVSVGIPTGQSAVVLDQNNAAIAL